MTKKNLMPVIVLSAICIAAALLLSVINIFTAPEIEKNAKEALLDDIIDVYPNGATAEPFAIDDKYPPVIKEAYKTSDGGFIFLSEVKGYASGLKILVGISSDGKIVGVKHTASNETYGHEAELNKVYIDKTIDTAELIIASGATPKSETSMGYFEAIKASLQAFDIAGGKEVDIRTPEQILQDNCNAIFGTSGVTFTKWFKTEIITGVDAVYESEVGRIYAIGENLVGIKDGMIINQDASDENKAAALVADNAVTSSAPVKITERPAGLPNNFVEASVTSSGNYVITAMGAGYGINGGWNTSGEYIRVKVSISKDGKIIDSLVVYHSETETPGGAALSNPDFIGQFEGKTKDDYNTVSGVSGATMSSDGYKEAIKIAFDAFELLKGGNV